MRWQCTKRQINFRKICMMFCMIDLQGNEKGFFNQTSPLSKQKQISLSSLYHSYFQPPILSPTMSHHHHNLNPFSKWAGFSPSSLHWRSSGFVSTRLRRRVCILSLSPPPPACVRVRVYVCTISLSCRRILVAKCNLQCIGDINSSLKGQSAYMRAFICVH